MGTGAVAPEAAPAGRDAGSRGAGKDAGAPLASFVPLGWRVAADVRARLDGDRVRDAALVLEESRADERGARGRRLVVLRGLPRGSRDGRPSRFVRVGEGRHVLLCSRCGGRVRHAAPTPVEIRIAAGVLRVRQSYGDRIVTSQEFSFRLREGRVRLVRYEERNRDRRTGRWARAATNLLTGDHVIETWARGAGRTYDSFGDDPREITLESCLQGAPLTPPR
jgi:hypothetical protein